MGYEHREQALEEVEQSRNYTWSPTQNFEGVESSCIACAVLADVYVFQDFTQDERGGNGSNNISSQYKDSTDHKIHY